QCRDRLGDALEAVGPVERFAREQFHLAVVEALIESCLDAIAVEFDLVEPVTTARWYVVQRGEARRHEVRETTAFAPAFVAVRRWRFLAGDDGDRGFGSRIGF